MYLTDQGKPTERWGRKVTELKGETPHASGTAGSEDAPRALFHGMALPVLTNMRT